MHGKPPTQLDVTCAHPMAHGCVRRRRMHLWAVVLSLLFAPSRALDACPARCHAGEETAPPTLASPKPPFEAGHVPRAPKQIGEHTFELPELLTAVECERLINATERAQSFENERIYFGYGYRPEEPAVSNRDVLRFWSDDLASTLLARLERLLPVLTAASGEEWHLAGINAGFRVARYASGDSLPTHTDHVTFAGAACCSAWTLTVYLNSVHPMQGGSTAFHLSHASGAMHIPRLQPRAGTGLLLAHDVLHSGAPLRAGGKYILRTEPLYWSGAPAGAGLGSLGAFAARWPHLAPSGHVSGLGGEHGGEVDADDGARPWAAGARCPLERVVASERECPTCS